MRALLTGGTGFIGSHLAERLLDEGIRVRILSRVDTDAERDNTNRLRERGVEILEGDVADRSKHGPALEGVRVVHHVAAAMREANIPDRRFWDTNLAATQDLARAAGAAGVERFVYCSTMGVTGQARGIVVDETAPYAPKDIYTRTKAAAEEWLLESGREVGASVSIVRPADVYGPRDRRLLKLFRMVKSGRFFYLGDGRGKRHMIYIDDLVDGMLEAQERPEAEGEVFILAGPAPITLRALVELVADELGVPAPRRRLPYRPAWWLSRVVEGVCRPLGIQPPLYPRRVEFYAHDYEFDTSKARKLLGFRPRYDTREGIRATLEAYRSAGLLA